MLCVGLWAAMYGLCTLGMNCVRICRLLNAFVIVVSLMVASAVQAVAKISVRCAQHTSVNECYISEPVVLQPGDRLHFVDLDRYRRYHVQRMNATYDAEIPLIPNDIFVAFPYLEQLSFRFVGLRELYHENFEYAQNLYNLTLSDNKLQRIDNSVFSLAHNLAEINLDGNEILHLENYAFNGLDKLYYLSLNKNRIITIKSSVFSGAPYLTDLRLEYNEIEVIEPDAFDLPNLLFLYLGHNQLKELPVGCFDQAPILGLDLTANQLEHLGDAIYLMKSVRKLILLENGKIDDLDQQRLDAMKPHLLEVLYDNNAKVIRKVAPE